MVEVSCMQLLHKILNNSYTPRTRDLQYLASRWPRAVTFEHSEGVTKGTEGC